jgi:glycosyltransferase involved in cell wall biosynthesis
MHSKIKRTLKFLFISSDKFPPFRIDVAVLFGKELISRGHQIDYLLQSDGDNNKFFVTSYSAGSRAFVGATDNGTKFKNRLRKHCLSILTDFRSVQLAIKERYDFIQVKDKFIAALIGIFAAKIARSKFFFWLSYPFPEADVYEYKEGTARYPYLYFIRGMFFKFVLYHIILPMSYHVFVQSDQMKKDIVLKGVDPNKITPVPMGIDLDGIPSYKFTVEDTIKREPNTIIYLGTMQKVRRIDFVIRVFRKVLDDMPNAILYMVGGSENYEDLEFLKMEAKRLNVDHATVFTDNLPRVDALKYVGRAAVAISPFFPTPILNSTSPTKLIEYMSLGTPVVANDHPEQRQVIEESKAGYCVRYNEDDFAEAILRLLRDRAKSIQMGINGEEYILRKRNYRVIANSLEDQYFRLLQSAMM